MLASASPRRSRLLEEAGIAHRVLAVEADETPPPGVSPSEAAMAISERKARAAAREVGAGLVLGADTIVVSGGGILGKPRSVAEAKRMLASLSGRTHEVVTGLCMLDAGTGACRLRSVATRVTFRRLAEREIDDYVDSGEPMDKAGAYGIQGRAGEFVARIEGSFRNVVGLPVGAVIEMMREFE